MRKLGNQEIRWLRPSTDDLICRASIPVCDWDSIARTFDSDKDLNYEARIKMFSAGRLVAISEFHYWARNSRSLNAGRRSMATTHHMLQHKLKTSARLIAGLRSWIVDGNAPLDPYAATAAGPQGLAMAERFSQSTPQLSALVRARCMGMPSCGVTITIIPRSPWSILAVDWTPGPGG